jgi:hypothetical protein
MENYQIDNLDRGILEALMANARTAYAELAKQFGVSPGTIHVRVEKMKQAGIITGAHIDVSPKQLGYDVCCFIGIILKSAKDYPSALAKLNALDEVTEAAIDIPEGLDSGGFKWLLLATALLLWVAVWLCWRLWRSGKTNVDKLSAWLPRSRLLWLAPLILGIAAVALVALIRHPLMPVYGEILLKVVSR